MPVRTAQLERTRSAIIEAAADLLLGCEDPGDFTMQAVADLAGVSHRTLYRHFATRGDLIDAVGSTLDERAERDSAVAGIPAPASIEEWVDAAPLIIGFGAVHRDLMRKALVLGVGSGDWRRDRDARYWSLFRERFPNLDDATARQDFAALRHLLSAFNAVLVGERFDLSAEQLAPGIQRAATVLVGDIDRRDRQAAGGDG